MYYKYTDEGKKKHMHELSFDGVEYKPLKGTTTIINEVYPPPLAWWASRMALEKIGFTTDKIEPDKEKRLAIAVEGQKNLATASKMTPEAYYGWLTDLYRNHDEYKKSKGKEGTDRHALIENYILDCLKQGGKPIEMENVEIKNFIDWAKKDVEKFLWSEAHCYSKKLWTGGITDFGFIHKNGMTIVGDNKPSIYPKHFIQTAGYSLQIRENGLFNEKGEVLLGKTIIDGFCIFDYNKGIVKYLAGDLVTKLESDFCHTVEMYDRKDFTGTVTLA